MREREEKREIEEKENIKREREKKKIKIKRKYQRLNVGEETDRVIPQMRMNCGQSSLSTY